MGECDGVFWYNKFMTSASVLGRATSSSHVSSSSDKWRQSLLELSTTSLQEPAAEHCAVSTPPGDKKLLGEM